MAEPTRRDLLYCNRRSGLPVGHRWQAVWPFVDQMNPDAGVQALASIEVNSGYLRKAPAITVLWRAVAFIRHRTQKEIEEAPRCSG
ncbi:MAG: hypothetical protein R3D43_02550 [Tepidamorphaceae bacterium]